jgi:hypothetical protein
VLGSIFILTFSFSTFGFGSHKRATELKGCEDLGFTGLALCSDCNTLAEYVKDQRNPPTNSLFGYYFENLILWVFLDFENLILDFSIFWLLYGYDCGYVLKICV